MIRLSLVAGAAALALSSPASAESRTYTETGFTGISVSAGINVSFRTGDDYAITAENRKGDFSDLEITVKNDTLVIGRKKKNWGWGKKPDYQVNVSAPQLDRISASSGSDIKGGGLSGDKVSIRTSSGADASITGIQATNVELDSSSGSDLDASGTCVSIEADASSGSDINAGNLICETGEADASSGADITIHTSRSIEAGASSGANITVRGNPSETDIDKSVSGSVRLRG
ncbi:DUF2807 domain-containing protein [Hyphomonas sp. FCG-A18]|uniref:GIN domain-containing protein n=1 Tax=Hyphomonas sp. FCG-A18 TaxID=3080019 RepID=UPI002B28F88C|nr:DUF2807 domain-containing protein [Hyphomonas sp. FCG-A18]